MKTNTPNSVNDELQHMMGLCRGEHKCWWSENIVGSDMDELQVDFTILGAIETYVHQQQQKAVREAMNVFGRDMHGYDYDDIDIENHSEFVKDALSNSKKYVLDRLNNQPSDKGGKS